MSGPCSSHAIFLFFFEPQAVHLNFSGLSLMNRLKRASGDRGLIFSEGKGRIFFVNSVAKNFCVYLQ